MTCKWPTTVSAVANDAFKGNPEVNQGREERIEAASYFTIDEISNSDRTAQKGTMKPK